MRNRPYNPELTHEDRETFSGLSNEQLLDNYSQYYHWKNVWGEDDPCSGMFYKFHNYLLEKLETTK